MNRNVAEVHRSLGHAFRWVFAIVVLQRNHVICKTSKNDTKIIMMIIII